MEHSKMRKALRNDTHDAIAELRLKPPKSLNGFDDPLDPGSRTAGGRIPGRRATAALAYDRMPGIAGLYLTGPFTHPGVTVTLRGCVDVDVQGLRHPAGARNPELGRKRPEKESR